MQALPFFDFLQELRRRGVPVSVSQHQDVARLCARLGGWPGCDAGKLASGMAALLGRSGPEVREIEQAFFQHYAKAYLFQDNAAALPLGVKQAALGEAIDRAQRLPKRQWMLWLLTALGVAVALLVAAQVLDLRRLHSSHMPEAGTGVKPPEPIVDPGPSLPNPPKPIVREPRLPDPIRLVHRGQQAVWVVPWPLLLLLAVYAWRRHKELRGWARRYWKEVRGALTGPTDFDLKLHDLRDAFLRQDLDDMATILGRGAEQHGGKKLNIARSVKATVEQAALPSLVFERKVSGRSLVVLWDVSAETRLWERKIKALVKGLIRRGVRMEVYYFDGNAARLSKVPHGKTIPLVQLQRQNPDAALLIISTGSRILDDREEQRRAGKLAPWLEQVRRFRLRAWLHPVGDDVRWRPELVKPTFWQRYLRVVPMTRAGLLAAAYELAQEADRRVHIPQEATRPARLVEEADVQKMQQRMALYPGAPLELVELVRQRFCPEAPDEVVLDLLATSQAHSMRMLRVDEVELGRLLHELQEQDAKLPPAEREEERVRRYLLKVLEDSEPAERASLGYMKWRLRKAMQQVYLHDPDNRNVNEAVATLKELVRGPLWKETHGELCAVRVPSEAGQPGATTRPIAAPVAARLEREVMTLVKQTAGGEVAKPQEGAGGDGKAAKRPGWLRLPQLGELAPATVLLAALVAIVAIRGVGGERIEHIKGYLLTAKLQGADSSMVELQVTTQKEGLPEVVTMCLNDDCEQPARTLTLRQGAWSEKRERPKADAYLHVVAKLPKGNLAYSDAVLIPGYQAPKKIKVRVVFLDAESRKTVAGVKYTLTDAAGTAMAAEAGQEVAVRVGPVNASGEAKGYGRFDHTSQPLYVDAELKIELKEEVPPGMVKIPAGRFPMGSNDHEDDEKPMHFVDMNAFYMDETEVTMEQYAECVKAGKCTAAAKTVNYAGLTGFTPEQLKKYSEWCNANYRGRGRHPVNCVDWNQAQTFCRWAGKRLPTEAEWEYAARGTGGREYPWGPQKPSSSLLNACGTECVEEAKKKGLTFSAMYESNDGWETTAPVGTFKKDKSPFDVLDLGGNVTEWVNDFYTECYKKSGCPTNREARVLRGGSWSNDDPRYVRAALRNRSAPAFRFNYVGFRCARTK